MRTLEDIRIEEYKRQAREQEEKVRQEMAVQKEIDSVLDKIKIDINNYGNSFLYVERTDLKSVTDVCIGIIDKYRKRRNG